MQRVFPGHSAACLFLQLICLVFPGRRGLRYSDQRLIVKLFPPLLSPAVNVWLREHKHSSTSDYHAKPNRGNDQRSTDSGLQRRIKLIKPVSHLPSPSFYLWFQTGTDLNQGLYTAKMQQCFRLIPRRWRMFGVLTLMWVFTGEIGIFYAYSLSWRWPVSQLGFTSGELMAAPKLRILLLSDPHIQCTFNRYESWLLRWDADQYLKKSFSLLVGTLHPEMVVILGDIFAEGFKASPQEWRDYLQVVPCPFHQTNMANLCHFMAVNNLIPHAGP